MLHAELTSDTAEYGRPLNITLGVFFYRLTNNLFSFSVDISVFLSGCKSRLKTCVIYDLPLMFPELLQCHWWRSRPRPGVTTGCCCMQKTMQNWAGACSKIIRKVRTLQCRSDCLSQLGDLCFVRCDLYLDFEILHQQRNYWKGRVLCQVLSKMRWMYLGLIWIWDSYLRKNR